MARLFSCGFELGGSVVAMPTGSEFAVVSADVTPLSIQTTTKRSGTYALRCGGSGQPLVSGAIASVNFIAVNSAVTGPWYARAYVRFATFPTASNTFMVIGTSGVNNARVKIDNSGLLSLVDEDGTIGTAASPLSLDTWYRIEVLFDTTAAGANDILRLYVDGVEVVGSATRDLALGTVTRVLLGGNLLSEANTVGEWYFDDFAINDATGSVQTSFPGAGSIAHLWPNADGDADTTVTRSSGATTPTGTDRGANWQQLGSAFDKPAPNDGTDFLLLTANTSEVLVACEDASVPGIGASDAITLVSVGGRVRTATASAGNWIPRIMSQSAGTKVSGDTVGIITTTWVPHDDTTSLQQYKLTSYTDPQAGGPWTPALIDSMQIGAATTDGNPDTLITALWALVEYVPEVVGTGQPTMKRWGGVPHMRPAMNGRPGGAW